METKESDIGSVKSLETSIAFSVESLGSAPELMDPYDVCGASCFTLWVSLCFCALFASFVYIVVENWN
jgi:hypothetical protein